MVAIALIMTPAALHRQSGGDSVSSAFLRISTRLFMWSMLPLAASLSIDCYLVARIIIGQTIAAAIMAFMVLLFLSLWFVVPRFALARRVSAGIDKSD
jgi:hypothetical protein